MTQLCAALCLSALQDFEKVWLKFEKATAEEKDLIIFDLKFPVSDSCHVVALQGWCACWGPCYVHWPTVAAAAGSLK